MTNETREILKKINSRLDELETKLSTCRDIYFDCLKTGSDCTTIRNIYNKNLARKNDLKAIKDFIETTF